MIRKIGRCTVYSLYTPFYEYQGIQNWTLCVIPAARSPKKKRFGCHEKGLAFPPPLLPLPPSIPEIRFIKRAYCLWCHGYPVITHSGAALLLFPCKPDRDLLTPKSNQLYPPPHHSPIPPLISCQAACALHCQQAWMTKARKYLKRGCDWNCGVWISQAGSSHLLR